MSLVPEKLINFDVFSGVGALRQLGVVTVELPSFEPMTETISGAGIAGEYESPVIGHFKSQVVKVKWRSLTEAAANHLASVTHRLDLRGSGQYIDSASGQLVNRSIALDVRGPMKKFGLGKFEASKQMEPELEIEVVAITLKLAGVTVLELDKFNYIYKVNGVDYLAAVRADLGGV